MKISELKHTLETLSTTDDLTVVTGDEWLPERLMTAKIVDELLFLEFDNAPDDIQGDEARGFVDHEIEVIKAKIESVLHSSKANEEKVSALLELFLLGHELGSSEFIEVLDASEQSL